MNALYAVFLFFVKIFYFICFPIKFHNKENIPSKDKHFLICSNHVSAHDICMVALKVKKQVHFITKEEVVKNPFINFFAKRLGVIPIKRGKADTKALREAIDYLRKGEVVCIFPQGTRIRDKAPEVGQFRNGAGMIVREAKCDVLPIYIRPKKHRTKFFRKVDIYYGEVIKYSEFGFESETDADGGRFSKISEASKLIAERICALEPEKNNESE